MNTDNNNISKLPSIDRYNYFIKTIAVNGELWTLIDTDGAFALFEVENTTVISLWSDEGYIESNLTPDWADCIPFKLDIDALQEILIPLIRQNDYRINVFPVDSRIGYIVTLNNFVEDLNREL
jgi:hypothetical protein